MTSDDRIYSKEHEWVMIESNIATVGVTEYAATELGDVVFIELPEPGAQVGQGDAVGTIETVKSVEDLYCPLTGEIVEINEAVLDAPELVNESPLDDGWLFKLQFSDHGELDNLLSAADYDAMIGG
ncbi:glycine cleavage system protein GcvH [bacterium]|nr:glycine cleavage system protein GcvH [bacterium]MBU1074365.1 glycine cleavage system protein GcvH [bacterium]MBU1675270.1 glycine cleavage system protein GcvH [bacterium]